MSDPEEEYFTQKADTPKLEFSQLKYLGSHASDSGLTCIVPADLYSKRSTESRDLENQELDYLELVTCTLERPGEIITDKDLFPMLQFCAPIPDEDSIIAVYGEPSPSDPSVYQSLVLRSWSNAFQSDSSGDEL